MKAAQMKFTATWYPSVPGYAAMIIDGHPGSTTGELGDEFWWLCVNDTSASKGMAQMIGGGDEVSWSYVSQATGGCPKD